MHEISLSYLEYITEYNELYVCSTNKKLYTNQEKASIDSLVV